jgi:hypothetical protein
MPPHLPRCWRIVITAQSAEMCFPISSDNSSLILIPVPARRAATIL